MKKTIKKTFHRSNSWKRKKKKRKKIDKARKKATKGLLDFNNFIRAINDEKNKATNLYEAIVNNSKSVFYATDKIKKHL